MIIKKIIKRLYKENFNNVFFEISEKPDRKFIDGRYTEENLKLVNYIKELIKKNGNIYFVEPDEKRFDKNIGMFHLIKNKINGKGILITGNVHANVNKIKIYNKIITPVGYYLKKLLKDDMISVNFIALKGTISNIDSMEIKEKQLLEGIFKSTIIGYDYEIRVKSVSPAKLFLETHKNQNL